MMQRATDQPVRSQFAPQGRKLAALAVLQKSLRDAQRAAKTSNNPPDGRNFDLRRRVPHQINLAAPDLPPNRHPTAIDRDTRALPFQRLEMVLFERAFQAALRIAAVLRHNAKRTAVRRFGG